MLQHFLLLSNKLCVGVQVPIYTWRCIRVPNDNAHAELINKLRSHMGDQQNVRQIQVDTLANIISMAGVATVGIKDRHNSLMDIIEVG